MKWLKNWRRLAGWVLAVAILIFLGATLADTWGKVTASGFQFQFNIPLLAVSLLMLVVGRGFAVEAWRRILLALGHRITFRFSFYTWFISNLTRYVPGNIWQVATMMVMVEQQGVTKVNALLSQAVYTAIALSVTALYGLTLLPIARDYLPLAALLFLALIIFFALPPVFRLMLVASTYLMRRIRKNASIEPPATLLPSFWHGLIPPLCSCLMWTINGTAFYLFICSITNVPLQALPQFIAMNAAAYFIGYISFITPSGLGFREASLAFFLAPYFPAPVAIALSLATRLWSTAGEMLGVIIAILGVPQGKIQNSEFRIQNSQAVVSPLPENEEPRGPLS
ncbi:MAG: lysylphosphatidylglycerol synthase domain-containing protein [Anaerolineae bacterium]